ncbi:hypothetical protein H5410_064007 [Solanum commersonii]|uniref:Uncharacterized protein n=1 Tax=Solanum commersonii TaxID=4109 RepID=A0A9J5W0F6_SOLCO|nr:hypothetical protein H5410_064007 [Solanum commersonii]
MEQCRQGKSAKWIRNFGKRIGSEGWARGSQSRTRRLSVDSLELLPRRAGRRVPAGTDWERFLRGPSRASNSQLRTGTDKGNPTRGTAPLFGPKARFAGRSGRKTLSGGEFGWGGTSVKR